MNYLLQTSNPRSDPNPGWPDSSKSRHVLSPGDYGCLFGLLQVSPRVVANQDQRTLFYGLHQEVFKFSGEVNRPLQLAPSLAGYSSSQSHFDCVGIYLLKAVHAHATVSSV
jgi:hypothetical protein